jgi:hypothetical protein
VSEGTVKVGVAVIIRVLVRVGGHLHCILTSSELTLGLGGIVHVSILSRILDHAHETLAFNWAIFWASQSYQELYGERRLGSIPFSCPWSQLSSL